MPMATVPTSRSPRRRAAPSAGRAFSQVEMLAVIVLLTVLAGFSILAYRAYQQRRLVPEAARRVVSLLGTAREQAITTNDRHQAVIHMQAATLWIDRGTSIPKQTTPIFLPDFVSVAGVTSQGTRHTSGIVSLTFYPDGRADPAAIELIEDHDRFSTATVRLYGSTGRARIFEP
jgi:Tfp pilus assembly protein FimT